MCHFCGAPNCGGCFLLIIIDLLPVPMQQSVLTTDQCHTLLSLIDGQEKKSTALEHGPQLKLVSAAVIRLCGADSRVREGGEGGKKIKYHASDYVFVCVCFQNTGNAGIWILDEFCLAECVGPLCARLPVVCGTTKRRLGRTVGPPPGRPNPLRDLLRRP
jgi:hypothetical protein